EFSPAPVMPSNSNPANQQATLAKATADPVETETLPQGAKVVGLEVVPERIILARPFEYVQLLITAKLETGDRVDATRIPQLQPAAGNVAVSPSGVVRPLADGASTLAIKLGDQVAAIPVEVTGIAKEFHPDFIRDVTPVMSRVGCNQGTCHGSV